VKEAPYPLFFPQTYPVGKVSLGLGISICYEKPNLQTILRWLKGEEKLIPRIIIPFLIGCPLDRRGISLDRRGIGVRSGVSSLFPKCQCTDLISVSGLPSIIKEKQDQQH